MSRVLVPAMAGIHGGVTLISGWTAIVMLFSLSLVGNSRFNSVFWSLVFKDSFDMAMLLLVFGCVSHYVHRILGKLPKLPLPA